MRRQLTSLTILTVATLTLLASACSQHDQGSPAAAETGPVPTLAVRPEPVAAPPVARPAAVATAVADPDLSPPSSADTGQRPPSADTSSDADSSPNPAPATTPTPTSAPAPTPSTTAAPASVEAPTVEPPTTTGSQSGSGSGGDDASAIKLLAKASLQRVGDQVELAVPAEEGSRVAVDWGDGEALDTPVLEGGLRVAHQYGGASKYEQPTITVRLTRPNGGHAVRHFEPSEAPMVDSPFHTDLSISVSGGPETIDWSGQWSCWIHNAAGQPVFSEPTETIGDGSICNLDLLLDPTIRNDVEIHGDVIVDGHHHRIEPTLVVERAATVSESINVGDLQLVVRLTSVG